MEDIECSTESEEQEEPIDPRIQEELEQLNTATDEINKLETELDEARARFRSTLNESGHRLTQLYRKYKRNVDKARPYYDARREAEQAQEETHRAAREFQRANSLYKAAKETIQLAEQRLLDSDPSEKREFDSAWQEMLNHATMRVMESEKEKGKSEAEHHKKASFYEASQHKVLLLEKKFKRAITNSKPYYVVKLDLEKQLEQQKIDVEDLQRAISAAKQKYSAALKNLERISEEVHLRRKSRAQFKLPPREPGVGAESVSSESSLPDVNLDNLEKGSYAGGLSDEEDVESVDSRDDGLDDAMELKSRSNSDESAKNVTFSLDSGADLKHPSIEVVVSDDQQGAAGGGSHSKMVPSETRSSMGDGCSETDQPDVGQTPSSVLLNDNVDGFVHHELPKEVHHHHHHHHHHHGSQSQLVLPPGGASHVTNRHSSHEQRRHSLQPQDITSATKRRANSLLITPGQTDSVLEPGAPSQAPRERRTSKVTQGLAHLNVNDLLMQHAQGEGQS